MYKDFLNNKWHVFLFGFIGLTLLFGAFSLGVRVGFHKSEFSGRLGENYYRNFEGRPRGGMMRGFTGSKGMMFDRELTSAHGTAGEVLDLNAQGLTVMDRDGIEKNVLVDQKTQIMKFRDRIKLSDLKTGEFVVVVGKPNSLGQLEAKLIRVMPTPPSQLNLKSDNVKTDTGSSTPTTGSSTVK